MIEATYQHKSGDIFELWTSKHGVPRITRCKASGEALISFEFPSETARTQAINEAVARGSITLVTKERES